MFNNIAFRIAFLLSLSLHLVGISAGNFFQARAIDRENREIEITYLMPEIQKEEIQEEIIERLPENYDMEEKDLRQTIEKEEALYITEKELKDYEAYIQYYELVRERIKKYAAKNYTRSLKEGAVEAGFILNKNGTLKSASVNKSKSTDSAFLVDAALKSIKEASPFPPFPDSLKKKELAFAIAIIFKKE